MWHTRDTSKKSMEELQASLSALNIRLEYNRTGELLDGAYLKRLNLDGHLDLSRCSLRNAEMRNADISRWKFDHSDLSDADLFDADLEFAFIRWAKMDGANFEYADLHATRFRDTNLSDATFRDSDLSNAHLLRADLSGAQLQGVTLEEAYLSDADITDTDLRHARRIDVDLSDADITNADLREAEILDLDVNQGTVCDGLNESVAEDPEDWDAIARVYHDLKEAFSSHGLDAKARDQHYRERRARGFEAKSRSTRFDGWMNPTYVGSVASRYLTGYGVRVRRVVALMSALFIVSSIVYWHAGIDNSLYYSVVTFTTSPPGEIPNGTGTRLVAMIETFLGTLLIVLLAYVLGNREQV